MFRNGWYLGEFIDCSNFKCMCLSQSQINSENCDWLSVTWGLSVLIIFWRLYLQWVFELAGTEAKLAEFLPVSSVATTPCIVTWVLGPQVLWIRDEVCINCAFPVMGSEWEREEIYYCFPFSSICCFCLGSIYRAMCSGWLVIYDFFPSLYCFSWRVGWQL